MELDGPDETVLDRQSVYHLVYVLQCPRRYQSRVSRLPATASRAPAVVQPECTEPDL